MTQMRKIELDARRLREREAAQAYLQETFGFPDGYGRNLDALYDMLGEINAARIVFYNAAALDERYGYARRVLRVCEDAARENPGLTVTVAEE